MDKVSRRAFLGAAGVSAALVAAGGRARAEEIEGETAKDPNNMTPLEQKHVPKITVKEGQPVEVSIVIGSVDHPMLEEHHIEWIDVYFDGKKLSRVTLTPEAMKACAGVTLTPKKSGTLTVTNKCNLHGIYKNSAEIKA